MQGLLSQLDELQRAIASIAIAPDTDFASYKATAETASTPSSFSEGVTQLQRQFQGLIAMLSDDNGLTVQVEQRIRPYQTEAHRLLRLLGVDSLRWQAAKQPATVESLRSRLAQQLSQLQAFVQAIANELGC
jgi:hypothetical protein